MSAFRLEHAIVDGSVRSGVRVEHADGVITAIVDGPALPGDVELHGLTLPGIANAHSHAFHRALRGRTHADGGDFWTWRQAMYAVAEALDPERYHALATAFYAELLLAGYTAVGEFHYLHGTDDDDRHGRRARSGGGRRRHPTDLARHSLPPRRSGRPGASRSRSPARSCGSAAGTSTAG